MVTNELRHLFNLILILTLFNFANVWNYGLMSQTDLRHTLTHANAQSREFHKCSHPPHIDIGWKRKLLRVCFHPPDQCQGSAFDRLCFQGIDDRIDAGGEARGQRQAQHTLIWINGSYKQPN